MRPIRPPLGFAHRGGRGDAPENTLEAFRRALASGATALESDAWVTADGVAVLDHDGVLPGLRRRRIRDVERASLPGHIPTLKELYEEVGTDFDLSLDLRAPEVAAPVIEAARTAGHRLDRLWLCANEDREAAYAWKAAEPAVRVVDSTRRHAMKEGTERRAATLAEKGIDAVNLHHTDWSVGLVTLFHRFEVLCFAWDCQHQRVLETALGMGVDGVFSDHVPLMLAVLNGTDRPG
ncbi:MAG TPA: glycerophosphodiester phosphodiesterase [Acidimicrobiales bacterium]|nr:glycerophosphodiester phosphodiesterase [Acidimicrobiales bacterium]